MLKKLIAVLMITGFSNEEYAVFEYNGYATAANEILNYVETRLEKLVPNLSGTYAALVFNRGLKYGVRMDN